MNNDFKEIKETAELNPGEAAVTAEGKPSKRKRRRKNKVRMNIWYKLGFGLFCAAFCLTVAAMAVCIIEDDPGHNSLFALWGGRISAGLALLGIIFVCVSKEKKTKNQKKKRRFKAEEEELY